VTSSIFLKGVAVAKKEHRFDDFGLFCYYRRRLPTALYAATRFRHSAPADAAAFGASGKNRGTISPRAHSD
jgi:hypothetical protein